jgi:hypothetical protein
VQAAKREAREKVRRNQERSKASGDAEETLGRLRAELAGAQRAQRTSAAEAEAAEHMVARLHAYSKELEAQLAEGQEERDEALRAHAESTAALQAAHEANHHLEQRLTATVQAAATQLNVQRANAKYLRGRIQQSNAAQQEKQQQERQGQRGRLTVEAFAVDVSGER